MSQRIIYQTLEDRDNPDEVEECGPFPCERKQAWVGPGFYFWDTFIELAHWWGKLNYSQTGYIICESSCDDRLDNVYDLVGKPELFKEITSCIKLIKTECRTNTVFMPEVFAFLKKKTDFLERYKAIRFYPERTRPDKFNTRYRFNGKNNAFLNTCPEIQFCFFDKSLFISKYKIVHPKEYCSDYVM